MPRPITTADLAAYFDEALPPAEMARIETTLREHPELAKQLVAVSGRRDAGVHSVGEIWRRLRLSCPSREQLGSYLLGVLKDDEADYIRFHFEEVGCRICAANLADLEAREAENNQEVAAHRHRKYFQSSAGYLRQ